MGASTRGSILPWYHGWNIVGIAMLSQVAANALTYNSLSLFLRRWSQDLHAPISTLLYAVPAMLLVASPLSPVVGQLAGRVPARRLFAIGLVGMGLFCVGISYATRGIHIPILYGLMAAPFLTLCTAIPANTVISRWFVRRLGLALGLSGFGIGLGSLLVPPIIAWLLPMVGWRMVWRGCGLLLILVVMPIVVAVIRDAPREGEGGWYLTSDGEGEGKAQRPHGHGHGHGHGPAARGGPAWSVVLGRRNFWLLVGIYLIIMGVGSAVVQNIAPIAAAQGYDESTAGLLLQVVGGAHVCATLLLGLFADRFGPALSFIGLAALEALGVAALGFGHGLPVLIAGTAMIGLNSGVFTPVAAAIAREYGTEGFGKGFGAALFFLPLSTPMTVLLARTRENTGSYTPAMASFIVLLGAVVVLTLAMKRRPASVLETTAPAE